MEGKLQYIFLPAQNLSDQEYKCIKDHEISLRSIVCTPPGGALLISSIRVETSLTFLQSAPVYFA